MNKQQTDFISPHVDTTNQGLPYPSKKIPLPRTFSGANQWVMAFFALGVVLRIVQYLLRLPLSGDEAMLAANLVNANYVQLTKTLHFNQVAPISFLWGELLMTKLFGFSEHSLRFVAVIAGVASLALFVRLAHKILTGPSLVLAVAVFSLAHTLIRYSAEVKPYSLDLFVTLILISVAYEFWQKLSVAPPPPQQHTPIKTRQLWALVVFIPVALSISFTSVFTAGAIGITLALPVWRSRDKRVWWTFIVFLCVLVVTFLVLLKFIVGPQYDGVRHDMLECWNEGFPPISHPLQLPLWLLRTFCGGIMGYPWELRTPPWNSATFVFFVVGFCVLWHSKQRWLATLTLAMIALGLVAAGMQRYPFGNVARLVQYLAPSICLLMGLGIAQSISWLRQSHWQERLLRWLICFLFWGAGAASLAAVIANPYKTIGTVIHRNFAQWFWIENPSIQNVCIDLDLHIQLYSPPSGATYLEPSYPCYRAMYDHQRIHFYSLSDLLSANPKNLRCVLSHSNQSQRNDLAFAEWLSAMNVNYELTGHNSYRLPIVNKHKTESKNTEIGIYEVYSFTAIHLQ